VKGVFVATRKPCHQHRQHQQRAHAVAGGPLLLTKVRVAGLTRAGARPGARGITINNVQPAGRHRQTPTPVPSPTRRARISLGATDASEVADFVAYREPWASFITGANLAVDGGYGA
jgi:3-oxoacyl-[acyl-carrier protein] reductase